MHAAVVHYARVIGYDPDFICQAFIALFSCLPCEHGLFKMGETLFFPPYKKHISGFILPGQQKVLWRRSHPLQSEDETEDWGALPHPPSQETCVKEVILWMYTYTALSVTLRTVCPVALTTFCEWTL